MCMYGRMCVQLHDIRSIYICVCVYSMNRKECVNVTVTGDSSTVTGDR